MDFCYLFLKSDKRSGFPYLDIFFHNGYCLPDRGESMKRAQPTDLISTSEARKLLGVSRPTMTRLIKEGQIRHFPNLIDKRVKLVSRAEVLALKPPRVRAA